VARALGAQLQLVSSPNTVSRHRKAATSSESPAHEAAQSLRACSHPFCAAAATSAARSRSDRMVVCFALTARHAFNARWRRASNWARPSRARGSPAAYVRGRWHSPESALRSPTRYRRRRRVCHGRGAMAFAAQLPARALARPAAAPARPCCARLGFAFRASPAAALRAAPARRARGLSVITRAEQVCARARRRRAPGARPARSRAAPPAATRCARSPAPPATQDYYQILGVPRGSDVKEMKKAYRQLARKYHPVRGAQPPSPTRSARLTRCPRAPRRT
jgi:hypothetical protein